jgi:antitoxin component of RelBE/YafQ-DinJ toxin-antitoxin module
MAETEVIYARIPAVVKQDFEDWAKRNNLSQATALTMLLTYALDNCEDLPWAR